MRALTSQFNIGSFTFRGCYSCTVKKSIHNYRQTAFLTLPASARLKSDAEDLPSRQTAKQFKVGDKAEILLGYDGNLVREFEGFVSRVNFSQPVEIEFEGYSWLLRKACNVTASWKSTTLKEVLQKLVDTVNENRSENLVALHPDIPNIPLKNIVINNATGTQIIDYIKGLFNGILQAFFIGNELYMGLSYADVVRNTVKYRLNWNTYPPNNLKFREADEVQVKVEIKFRNDTGKQVTTTAGKEGGIVRRDNLTVVTDNNTIKRIAEAKLAQETFDGYEGNIATKLAPFCQHGWRAEVEDLQYPERSGIYFVESTTVVYGVSGTRRTIELGIRLV